MANQIPVLLSAGLGIIPFTTCDITGYCGDIEDYPAMAELYTRWIQMGAFNPLSRIHHEGNVAVEPWLFGEEAEKNAKAAIELKYRLLPYIYTYAREAHETGLPLMRPMFLEYPADMETFSTDAQFMFGSELLVAPVVKKGAPLLPIDAAKYQNILVVGDNAVRLLNQGGGSSELKVKDMVSPLDGLRAAYGDKVAYAKGYAAGRPMYGRADEIPQNVVDSLRAEAVETVSYTHLRAHET